MWWNGVFELCFLGQIILWFGILWYIFLHVILEREGVILHHWQSRCRWFLLFERTRISAICSTLLHGPLFLWSPKQEWSFVVTKMKGSRWEIDIDTRRDGEQLIFQLYIFFYIVAGEKTFSCFFLNGLFLFVVWMERVFSSSLVRFFDMNCVPLGGDDSKTKTLQCCISFIIVPFVFTFDPFFTSKHPIPLSPPKARRRSLLHSQTMHTSLRPQTTLRRQNRRSIRPHRRRHRRTPRWSLHPLLPEIQPPYSDIVWFFRGAGLLSFGDGDDGGGGIVWSDCEEELL